MMGVEIFNVSVQVGPLLIKQQPEYLGSVFASMFVTNIVMVTRGVLVNEFDGGGADARAFGRRRRGKFLAVNLDTTHAHLVE